MKIPSLFRTPRYQRFNIEPRYYDPVKEEVDERTERIKRELQAKGEGDVDYRSSRIAGAFKKGRSGGSGSATFTQLVIMMLLAFAVFGYIYLGNIALYIFAAAASLLLYLKMRRII
ncbi:hypothetical protein [Fulvivirga lutea]|uniref:Uncharacterized protein n=1 Tax=Fulvivirga lutea TaxID=2810512 RepID=A0A974WFM3_9BACT|nr:hypothetical protein [Fulvivirga lutea]QSE97351.1 hypothetical protein JR347_17475 [Fulvivirga lutea]